MSESPPGTGTAPAGNRDGQTAACQHPSAHAVAATSPRTRSRSFLATADQVREARQFLAEVLDGIPLAADALTCLSEPGN